MVPAQVGVLGEQRRCCSSCGRRLASKGHYPVTFRSLFGDVPVRIRRLLICPCQGVLSKRRLEALLLLTGEIWFGLTPVSFGRVACLMLRVTRRVRFLALMI